jgi:protein arginine kinase activator
MICQECQKREAAIHIKKMVNGVKKEQYLCEVCAAKKSADASSKIFNLKHLLSALMEMEGSSSELSVPKEKRLECPNCGVSYERFKSISRFGCAECYQNFETKIEPLFRKIHGNSIHRGKTPKRKGKEYSLNQKIKTLKIKMQQAINEEAFEEAAKIRDEIKSLEEGK